MEGRSALAKLKGLCLDLERQTALLDLLEGLYAEHLSGAGGKSTGGCGDGRNGAQKQV